MKRWPSGFGESSTRVGIRVVDAQRRDLNRVQVGEFDRALLMHDQLGRSPDRVDPTRELIGVRDRRRQADEPDSWRRVDDHFLPDRAPIGVLEVVNLVEDDVLEAAQRPRAA